MSETTLSAFSPDYASARERFLEKSEALGARLDSIALDAKGPNGLPLSIDIAQFGAPAPSRVLLHCSGIHGVEGFAGSAIQLHLLQRLPELPDDAAIVFVHIINPFGMSWLRRVNESNVDLNRNFLAGDEAYAGVPEAYTALDPMLNPDTAPGFDFFLLRTLRCIQRHGYNTLKQAIVGGQYGFPEGLFFGGTEKQQGPQKYQEWLSKNLSSAKSVLAIDVHTGLGKSGKDTLLVEGEPGDSLYDELRAAFGDRVAPWDPEDSIAYAIRGGHSDGVHQALPGAAVQFITQEFGTLPPLKVLHALREENRWHHHGAGTLQHKAKKGLLAAFRPHSKKWESAVLKRGQELAEQAYALAFSN